MEDPLSSVCVSINQCMLSCTRIDRQPSYIDIISVIPVSESSTKSISDIKIPKISNLFPSYIIHNSPTLFYKNYPSWNNSSRVFALDKNSCTVQKAYSLQQVLEGKLVHKGFGNKTSKIFPPYSKDEKNQKYSENDTYNQLSGKFISKNNEGESNTNREYLVVRVRYTDTANFKEDWKYAIQGDEKVYSTLTGTVTDGVKYFLGNPTPPSSKVEDTSIKYGNMIAGVPANDYGVFASWMRAQDIVFTTNENAVSANTDISTIENPVSIASLGDNKIYDISQFVEPFDISTNLFTAHYDNGGDLIINAKKMYSAPEDDDNRPVDCSLDVDMSSLSDKEFVLTGIIPFGDNSSEVLKEQHLYRNDNYEYYISDENLTESSEFNTPVRYVDGLANCPQWNLYRLTKDVPFTSVDDIDISVIPANNNGEMDETFKVPCKMKVSFRDLLFKKQIRSANSFDNVNNIEYDTRLLTSGLFDKKNVQILSSRWNIPSSLLSGGLTGEYYAPDWSERSGEDEYSLGGLSYWNDIDWMTRVENSANGWETTRTNSEWENILVFSDYSPNKIVGTPYLNMEGTTSVNNQRAEIAKIATDKKFIDYLNPSTEIPTKYVFATNAQNYFTGIEISSPAVEGNYLTVNLSATMKNTDLKGAVYFNIENGTVSENKENGQIAIYFDGNLFNKDVYINLSLQTTNVSMIDGISQTEPVEYTLLAIKSSDITLAKDGTLKGTIVYQTRATNEVEESSNIELHNVKPLRPTIKKIKFTCGDGTVQQLDNNIWRRNILMNKEFEYSANEENQPFFMFDTEKDLRSEITEIKDDTGKTTGLFVKLKVFGLKKFEGAGAGVTWYDEQTVDLNTEEKLSSYQELVTTATETGLSFPGMKTDAVLGDEVISGLLRPDYSNVRTVAFDNTLEGAGSCFYTYSPLNNDRFQIEIIKKLNHYSGNKITRALYYVNLPVGHWYNLALERTTISGTDSLEFTLTDVDGDSIDDVTNKSKWLFPINVTNESILEGLDAHCGIPNTDIPSVITGAMENFKSKYEVEFDGCGRSLYDEVYYVKNQEYYSTILNADNFTTDDYENQNLEGKGVTRISNILNGITTLSNGEFFNDTGYFGICANDKVKELVKTDTIFEDEADYSDDLGENMVHNYVPRRILINGQSDRYWTIAERDTEYHIVNVSGMEIGNIMYVSTPDLSTQGNYYDMPNNSLAKVKEYGEYFGNPQHRLPPVSYQRQILSSDYATMVYNASEKNTGYSELNTSDEGTVWDYTNNPKILAYVWNNSKVTRNESYGRTNTLSWTRSSCNEYIAENGSIYNYTNLGDKDTGYVTITADSPLYRQTTLYPVLGSPMSIEKKLDGTATVNVNEKIIATAALGYNTNGYPLNGMMIYNSNGAVKINTDRTTYLYVSMNESQTGVNFGATEEKPVFVDSVQGNNSAYAERFEFLPNPLISENASSENSDVLVVQYGMGNSSSSESTENDAELFEEGDANVLSAISDLKYFSTTAQFKECSVYDNDSQLITNYTIGNAAEVSKGITFVANRLGMRFDGDPEMVKSSSFNVFYDTEKFKTLSRVDQIVDKCWQTMNCFFFDGKMVPDQIGDNSDGYISIAGIDETDENSVQNAIVPVFLAKDAGYEVEPSIGAIWLDRSFTPSDFSVFNEGVPEGLDGHAIFDKYFSCDLTGVKLTIKQEHLTYAPVWIKVYLLKYTEENGFVWVNDEILDIDLRDTYSDEYGGNWSDKVIDKQFVMLPDNLNLTKRVFGIKFVVKQIVPQNNKFNPCIIDDIRVYASNKLNKYGQSISVDDKFVRKVDANCRNFYQIDVKEYVWRLPRSKSEWATVGEILEKDSEGNQEYIDKSAWGLINNKGIIQKLSNSSDASISEQINQSGDNFSFINTYYITDGSGEYDSNRNLTNLVSDNHTAENENISVTWKYVDYVYVYYSSESTNTRFLLDKYFGNAIFQSMKQKLNSNITALNANNSLNSRFTFSGGIAVQKSDLKQETDNSLMFDWKSNLTTTEHWQDVWTTTTYDTLQTKLTTTVTDIVATQYVRKSGCHHTMEQHPGHFTASGSWVAGHNIKETLTDYYSTEDVIKKTTDHTGTSYYNSSSVSNPKYTSVDNWLSSFEPISIKYRID